MGYSLQFHEDRVVPYLFHHAGLSREDRVKVFTALNYLRDGADPLRASSERRLAPNSPYFWYDLVLRCSDGRIRRFWFVISDAAAMYGILRVEYVEEGGPVL